MKIWTQSDVDAWTGPFPANSSFVEGCSFEDGHKARPDYPFLSLSGAGSANRTTYFFNCEDGIWVRSGCFFGTLSQFRDKVRADDHLHATAPNIKTLQYLGFVNIAAVTFDQTQLET